MATRYDGQFDWFLVHTAGKYQDAIAVFLDAMAHAEHIESRHQKAHCCDALSHLYERVEEPLKALEYARRHQFNAEIA